MRVCIVSDIHYKFRTTSQEEHSANLTALSFLRSLPGKYDWLILNGDIFDLWFDWEYTLIKGYFPVLAALWEIRQSGTRIAYVSGNHDFWFGDFLPQYLDISLYPDAFVLEVDGKKTYFTHGDMHTTNDLRYQFFRRVIRLPFTRFLFTMLHPDVALGLGRLLSRSSRQRRISGTVAARKKAGLLSYATSLQHQYDYILMGHTHEPLIQPLDHAVYANSGDWIKHKTYLTLINGSLSLHEYQA